MALLATSEPLPSGACGEECCVITGLPGLLPGAHPLAETLASLSLSFLICEMERSVLQGC